MQGTAADLIKLAMIAVHRWLAEPVCARAYHAGARRAGAGSAGRRARAVKQELPRLMTGVAQLAVPLLVEVGAGPNWDQAH